MYNSNASLRISRPLVRDIRILWSFYNKGTSKNLPHGELSMTNIICCVDKPCNTSSITAVCRLVTDICHIRNFARVPVFREPHKRIKSFYYYSDNENKV